MTLDQILLAAILAAAVILFIWGRWRHDVVALAALVACVFAGLVSGEQAFSGFGHPAVITVAAVLILSSALEKSGAVDAIARTVLPKSAGPFVMLTLLTVLVAVLSAFMNNVGALALLMPVALQAAAKKGVPPGRMLMPLAFGSILGGMTTLIGTPTNLIVASYRPEEAGGSFTMFDFAPVGVVVALAGTAFLLLAAWRLVPDRKRASVEGFETSAYLTEARVAEKSKAAGLTLREVDSILEEADAQVVGLVRDEVRIPAPSPFRKVRPGDIIVIEADPEGLTSALSSLGLQLEEEVSTKDAGEDEGEDEAEEDGANESGDGPRTAKANAQSVSDGRTAKAVAAKDEAEAAGSDAKEVRREDKREDRSEGRKVIHNDDVLLVEMAVAPGSEFAGRSASGIRLRSRFSINLLAVSRYGNRSRARLRTMTIREGDVLLMQGSPDALSEFASQMGCIPLAERTVRIPDRGKAWAAGLIMLAAVGAASLGLASAAVAFTAGVLAVMLLKIVPVRSIYEAVDWPVIVLLGALIPVAGAMQTTGADTLIAEIMLDLGGQASPALVLGGLLVLTMALSCFMNNAATAAVMSPIAVGLAAAFGASPDPFLMAVAIGASAAFATPIGHQNNTLILGPGGFKFSDYWPLGLPVSVIVTVVAVPMILWVWPL